jgi:hypothetical protein
MTEQFKTSLKASGILLLSMWSLNIFGFLIGLMEGVKGPGTYVITGEVISICYKPKTRIEYLFPGLEFGCWVSQPVNRPYHDYESRERYEAKSREAE